METFESRSIQVWDQKITYSLFRRARRSLQISLTREGLVRVLAPKRLSMSEIEWFLLKKSPWVTRQLANFQNKPSRSALKYVSWEKHLYLGVEYLLETSVNPALPESVSFDGNTLQITANKPSHARALLHNWYDSQAREFMTLLFLQLAQDFVRRQGKNPKQLAFRRMKSRWGSCSALWKITLNTDLIRAPRECIEYVILHELCHLVHFGHGKAFHALQAHFTPHYKELKKRLNVMLG